MSWLTKFNYLFLCTCFWLFSSSFAMNTDSISSYSDDLGEFSDPLGIPEHSWTVGAEKKPRRLAIYCDNFGDEGIGTRKRDAIAHMFAQTLHQKASTIIVSRTIFRLFVFMKQPVNAADSEGDRQRKEDASEYVFDSDDWDIYFIKDSSFFLLQPKDFSKYDLVGSTELKLNIFKRNNLEKFTLSKSGSPLNNSKKLVVLGKFIKNLAVVSSSLKNALQDVFCTRDDVEDIFIEGPGVLHDYEEALAQQRCRGKLDFLYAPWNVFICGHGSVDEAIAGVSVLDFCSTLKFFNEALNTKVMLVSSCYVAGKNQRYMDNEDLNYLLIIAGMQQAVTIGLLANPKKPDASMDVGAFFKNLEKRGVEKVLAKAVRYCTVPNDWFSIGLGINSLPQILVPGNDQWKPLIEAFSGVQHIHNELTVDTSLHLVERKKAVLVSSNLIDKAVTVAPCSSRKKPKWLKDWNKFPVVNECDEFFPTFMSANTREPYHLFKTINVSNGNLGDHGVLWFLRDSFLNIQERTQPIYWYVQNLIGSNDISTILKNVRKGRFVEQRWQDFLTQDELKAAFLTESSPSVLETALGNNTTIVLRDVVVCAYDVTESNPAWSIVIMFSYENKYYRMHLDNALIVSKKKKSSACALWQFEGINKSLYDESLRSLSLDFVRKIEELNAEDSKIVAFESAEISQINRELSKLTLLEGIA